MAMSVSTLGTHIFGSEEPTKSKSSKRKTEEKPLNKSIHDSIRHVIDSDKEDREAGSTTSSVRSFSSELEEIAEKELKAREAYIKATKKRQELRKSGVKEDSEEWKTSEKTLRDGYAQMEYWESVYAKELKRFRADDSVGSGESSKPDSLSKMLGKRDSFKIDCDEEESKAREAYTQAMTYHQTLITQKVSTNSEEWTKSQKRIQDCYATLQYWERRSSSAVLPAA